MEVYFFKNDCNFGEVGKGGLEVFGDFGGDVGVRGWRWDSRLCWSNYPMLISP
jgi:hypothetical protein